MNKVQKYLMADSIINDLEIKYREARMLMYQYSLCTHLEFSELGIVTVAPRVDKLICDNDLIACAIFERLEQWKIRKRYFERYVNEMPENERESLLNGNYSQEVYEEIEEIEQAIQFRYEIYEPGTELTGDLMQDIAIMSEVFA